MQNIQMIEDSNPVLPKEQAAWIKLWHKNWNYTHWLMTSMITTVISSEIYSILLSIYPEFLNIFWLNLGITSSTFASILTFSTILGLGVLSGLIFYSLQLFVFSLKSANNDYKPLINLWKTYNHQHDFAVNQLFTDENFRKLSMFLKDQPLPAPIVHFLSNNQNIEQIKSVLNMLKRIWQIEGVDNKLKALTLNILSEVSKSEHTQQHIDNIAQLCNLLLDNHEFNENTVIKALDNSSLLQPLLPKLQQITFPKDLLYKLIAEPKLMEYFLVAQELFSGQDERIIHDIEILYLYLVNDLSHPESYAEFKKSQTPNANHAVISPDCFIWLQSFQHQPTIFLTILDNLLHHPKLDWIEHSIVFMADKEEFKSFIHNPNHASHLTTLFNRLSILEDVNFQAISELFKHYQNDKERTIFCNYLMLLNQINSLNEKSVIHILNQPNLESQLNFFKLYVEKIWNSTMTSENTFDDIQSIFVENSKIKQSIIDVSKPEVSPERSKTELPIVKQKPSRGVLHWMAKRLGCSSSSAIEENVVTPGMKTEPQARAAP